MSYTRMTEGKRNQLYAFKQAGFGVRRAARELGVSPSTVSRELSRNTGQRGYRPRQAQEMAAGRARRSGARRFTEEVRLHAEERLRRGWTPERICGRAALEGRVHVSRETVYRHIYGDARRGGTLWACLPRSRRKRKSRRPRLEGRGRGVIPGRRGIETRPASVEARSEVGHWEGDLVVGAGASGYLVTLVERVTRYALVGWSATKGADEVAGVIVGLLSGMGRAVTGITFDNGKEFARHADIAEALKADVFFARPYHSWERGTNENTNGLIRRLYPKSAPLADVTGEDLARICAFLNGLPKKCLGWRTPEEAMAAFLVPTA